MAVNTAQTKEAGRAPLPLTARHDNWWIKPLLTVIVLGGFVLYASWRAFVNSDYEWGPYLSPFYSPLLLININVFGWTISPALYILIFPLRFRLPCTYYRLCLRAPFFCLRTEWPRREPWKSKRCTG